MMEGILAGVAVASFLVAALGVGYLLGRHQERLEWLYWLKTLKHDTCNEQCRRRFMEKNGIRYCRAGDVEFPRAEFDDTFAAADRMFRKLDRRHN
jgi:hypothetical protein